MFVCWPNDIGQQYAYVNLIPSYITTHGHKHSHGVYTSKSLTLSNDAEESLGYNEESQAFSLLPLTF